MIDFESPYFNEQRITYLGNKRSLLKQNQIAEMIYE